MSNLESYTPILKHLNTVDPSPSHRVVLCIVIVIIVVVVVYIIIRADLSTTVAVSKAKPTSTIATVMSKVSTNVEPSVYGSYDTSVETPCLTTSGLCTEQAYKTIIQQCLSNPTTGYGCLTPDGFQSFEMLVQRIGCQPQCREFIWQNTTASRPICELPAPYNDIIRYPCLPPDITGIEVTTLRCIPNDGYGVNTCTYICGTDPQDQNPASQSYLPVCEEKGPGTLITLRSLDYTQLADPSRGLKLSKGYTITGRVSTNLYTIEPPYQGRSVITYLELQRLDQEITLTQICRDPSRGPCGVWRVPHLRDPITSPCRYNSAPDYSSECDLGLDRTLESGLYDPTLLFSFGHYSLPMRCLSQTSSNTANPTCLSFIGQEAPCLADLGQVDAYVTSQSTPTSVQICVDPQNPNVPGCAQPCVFIAQRAQLDLSPWAPSYQQLIGALITVTLVSPNHDTGVEFLTLRQVPCAAVESDSLDLTRQTTEAALYDCAGDPSKPLNPVRTMLIYSGGDRNGTYWDRGWCTSDRIMDLSSVLLMIKPFKPQGAGMDCNILGILGKRYIGWLDYEIGSDGLTYLIWRQAKSSQYSHLGESPNLPRFTLLTTGSGHYDLHPYNQSTPIYSLRYGEEPRTLTSLKLESMDMIPEALDKYLYEREERCMQNSCNLQFDHIPHLC